MANNEESVGRAYGFFYCNASKHEIETELPIIRKLVKTPPQLELFLIKGMDNVIGDSRLTSLAREAKQDGINYVLQAICPDGTGKDTANEVASILNQAYQSPLYESDESDAPFKAIVYEDEETGEYVFRD